MRTMLYLASRSPRRRRLLGQLHRPFRVVRSSYRECIRPRDSPSGNVKRNARGKVDAACVPAAARGIVIGADTLLSFRGQMIGKPRTVREARRLLRALSGHRHWVYTGLCLRDLQSGKRCVSYDRTRVTFRCLSETTITRLLSGAAPLDKAGGYAIQKNRDTFIASIEGSTSTVVGLPLGLLRRELARLERRANISGT